MKLEEEINQLIQEIEQGLLKDEINTTVPHVALEKQSKLGAYLSTSMGLIEKLDTLEAQYFIDSRERFKSDNATKKSWETTEKGIRQRFWENRIKRIEVLIKTLEKLYYHGRDEMKQKELK